MAPVEELEELAEANEAEQLEPSEIAARVQDPKNVVGEGRDQVKQEAAPEVAGARCFHGSSMEQTALLLCKMPTT